jgi:hypothetical protein
MHFFWLQDCGRGSSTIRHHDSTLTAGDWVFQRGMDADTKFSQRYMYFVMECISLSDWAGCHISFWSYSSKNRVLCHQTRFFLSVRRWATDWYTGVRWGWAPSVSRTDCSALHVYGRPNRRLWTLDWTPASLQMCTCLSACPYEYGHLFHSLYICINCNIKWVATWQVHSDKVASSYHSFCISRKSLGSGRYLVAWNECIWNHLMDFEHGSESSLFFLHEPQFKFLPICWTVCSPVL